METSTGKLFACSLNHVVEAKGRGRHSRSAKGRTCERVVFSLSLWHSPEDGCVFSESSLPQISASVSLAQP